MNRNNNYEYNETLIQECDSSFQEYLVEIMNNQGNIDRSRELYDTYQKKRNELNREIFQDAADKYKSIIESDDARKLWKSINWSGDIRKTNPRNHPPLSWS